MDYSQIWTEVVESVKSTITDPQEQAILGLFPYQISVQVSDTSVTFYCSTEFVSQVLPKYAYQLFSELKRMIGVTQNLSMLIKNASEMAPQPQNITPNQVFTPAHVNAQQGIQKSNTGYNKPVQIQNQEQYQLNLGFDLPAYNQPREKIPLPKFMDQDRIRPDKTFENYVDVPENKLTRVVALEIAKNPGSENHNPFYIYGGSGLGKTHLLFAIANEIKRTKPEVSVIYTRAEDFIHNYVESMSRRNFDPQQVHFQDLFTQHDVFIMDDIQGLIKAEKARDTFFDIIANFLDKPGRQLILASDVPPGNLKNFSSRLISRFGSGVCREIFPPTEEIRKAIAIMKCREFHTELPASVIDYIAKNIRSSVREIEGAIKTLSTHQQSFGSITYDEAVKSLSNLINVTSQVTTIDAIKTRVAKEYDITVASMESAQRKKIISGARSIAMTLANDLIPTLSLNDIGRAFNKDHSSVYDAIKRTRENLTKDQALAAVYQKLTLSLKRD